MIKLIDKLNMSLLRKLCMKHKIQFIVLKDRETSIITKIIIFCNSNQYMSIFSKNKLVKRCKEVYFNISECDLHFELYEGSN